jgi:hypothetical protein
MFKLSTKEVCLFVIKVVLLLWDQSLCNDKVVL